MKEPLIRLFRDYFNREWEVQARHDPSGTDAFHTFENPALAPGSLEFTSGEERRRLDLVPPGWFVASDELLSRWCQNARAIPH
jgi:hypothetical protein